MKIGRFLTGGAQPENAFEKDLEKGLDKIFSEILDALNGGLGFSDNFSCFVTTITTDATPGNTTSISHGLKRVPIGCLVIEQNKAGSVFLSSKSATNYIVKSDVASVTATVVIL